jgi:hypothetical protein
MTSATPKKEIPAPLGNNKNSSTLSWCRTDPFVCVRQASIESGFLAAAYLSLLFITGGDIPGPLALLKFVVVFTLLSLAARMVSDDLGNKMSITAISGMGSKVVSILAPKFVAW